MWVIRAWPWHTRYSMPWQADTRQVSMHVGNHSMAMADALFVTLQTSCGDYGLPTILKYMSTRPLIYCS